MDFVWSHLSVHLEFELRRVLMERRNFLRGYWFGLLNILSSREVGSMAMASGFDGGSRLDSYHSTQNFAVFLSNFL